VGTKVKNHRNRAADPHLNVLNTRVFQRRVFCFFLFVCFIYYSMLLIIISTWLCFYDECGVSFEYTKWMDRRLENRKKLASYEATLVPLIRSWWIISNKKTNRSARRCIIWRYSF
jgi:hypothetical protein